MPAWIAAAFRMLALGFGTGVAFEGGSRLMGGGGAFPTDLVAGAGGRIIDQAGHIISDPHRKRRRRRRALTASDRADIAFIVGLLGPTAGKNFAVTLAGRSR